MSGADILPAPEEPLTLDQVIERYPTLRQSLLSNYDDCALYAYFGLRYTQGWSTHPQARGTLFHRFAAEALRTMQANDWEQVPVSVALAILEEVLEQRGVPAGDRVRLPLREVPVLRMACAKFAKDNRFTIRKVIDVEKRLEAPLHYIDDEGTIRERRLSGMPDALVMNPKRPEDGIIVLDWKATWALPPEREGHERDAAEKGLSYEGYFQQRFYAWLLLKNYPRINSVTLREFYVYRSKPRQATIERTSLETVEEDLANLARDFDRSLMAGKPERLRYPEVESWEPSPGKHCFYCPARHRCPIDDDVLSLVAVKNEKEARTVVGLIEKSEALAKGGKEAVRPYIEEHGPVASRHSKGRRAYGLRTNSSGKPEARFFTPEGADRAPVRKPEDRPLEEALREAARREREEKAA